MLENIKISELPSVYLVDKDRLPNCAAIYFVFDSKGQIIYIGRTINLVERWKAHHRFNQLKRFNRKNPLSISWLTCSSDIENLSNLENEFIKLYKPPLNWSKVVVPIRKITPAETALQQSLQQLAKLNVMMVGFDPISDGEPPTIYLVYPVYGMKGLSGSIRTALKNINKKASSLKWKEYKTYSKSSGKFGFWETEYNGLRIDLSPFDSLVYFMEHSNRQTLAGIELMAFSREQLELILDKKEENDENTSGLEALEDDPIPVENIYKNQSLNSNYKNPVEVEPWEELKPMAEGEVRVKTCYLLLTRKGVDAEIIFINSRQQELFTIFNLESHYTPRIIELMKKYADLPMDLADASLVILAEHLGHGRIFSVDQRDFNTYRWKQSYPFENILF